MTPVSEQVKLESYIKKIEARLARLETRDLDLKGRRARGASDALDSKDYTTLQQVQKLIPKLNTSIPAFKNPLFIFKYPLAGTTNGYVYSFGDNITLSFNLFYDINLSAWKLDDPTVIGYALVLDTAGLKVWEFPVGGALTLALALTSTTLGFFGAAAVAQQTLSAYTTAPAGGYTGIDNLALGTVYAQVGDLNALAGAYENLRLAYDDLRTKLLATGLIA